MPQCKAKSKQSGERCKRHAAKGRLVCRMHGGATPRGMDSPHYKHGMKTRDRYMSKELALRYNAAATDPNLMSLEMNVALIETRMREILPSVGVAGKSDRSKWNEIIGLIEAQRRIIDTIGKQQIRAQEALTLDRASVLFTALARAVTRNVADKASLERVLADFQTIVGKEAVPIQAQLMAEREEDTEFVRNKS